MKKIFFLVFIVMTFNSTTFAEGIFESKDLSFTPVEIFCPIVLNEKLTKGWVGEHLFQADSIKIEPPEMVYVVILNIYNMARNTNAEKNTPEIVWYILF